MSLSHPEIISRIQARTNLSKSSVENVLKSYYKIMIEELRMNGEFTIPKVGVISLRKEGGYVKEVEHYGKKVKRYIPYRIYPLMKRWSVTFRNNILVDNYNERTMVDIVQEHCDRKNSKAIEQEARRLVLEEMFRQGKNGEKIDGGKPSKVVDTALDRGLMKEFIPENTRKARGIFIGGDE